MERGRGMPSDWGVNMLNRNIFFLQKYFCRLHECSLHQITTEMLVVGVVKHY